MKKNLIVFFALLILVGSACTPSQTNNEGTEKLDYQKLEREAREMLTYSMEAFNNKDLDGLVSRFTSNGSLKIPNAPLVIGTEALRENYQGTLQLENFDIQLTAIKVEIAEAGDLAYVLADFSVSFNTPGGPFSDAGNSLLVLKRVDDTWKIVAENLSSGPVE